MKRKSIISLTIFLSIILLSCAPRVISHGNFVEKSQAESIVKEKYSQDTIIELIGNPTFIDTRDNQELWFYAFYKIKKHLFFPEEYQHQDVFVLKFDETSKAQSFKYYDSSKIQDIKLSETFTPIEEEEINTFKTIFSNLMPYSGAIPKDNNF